MHDDPTRKVPHTCIAKDPTIRQETAAPDPMHNGCVAQQHPQAREQQHKAKADPFHICADNQCRCDDCECHLERKEQNLGQGAC